ncbi:hypothetical protein C8R45DRAFT_1042756 [Mycena sanguinolenta]|nr:hypothetical protein C8R45DRAFT_1042756 [Mycena sanguinolenta]
MQILIPMRIRMRSRTCIRMRLQIRIRFLCCIHLICLRLRLDPHPCRCPCANQSGASKVRTASLFLPSLSISAFGIPIMNRVSSSSSHLRMIPRVALIALIALIALSSARVLARIASSVPGRRGRERNDEEGGVCALR